MDGIGVGDAGIVGVGDDCIVGVGVVDEGVAGFGDEGVVETGSCLAEVGDERVIGPDAAGSGLASCC